MASAGSTQAIIERREDELALMPPPPTKRIKRPAEVLDENDYTEALSDIIARDYYPGLREAQAQEDYIDALESRNSAWIRKAEQNLRRATGEAPPPQPRRATRDGRFDTLRSYRQAADTPRTTSGADTPASTTATFVEHDLDLLPKQLDTNSTSLAGFQAKYTSEDNESFNKLLDKQNVKRRQKNAHLWTSDQKKLSQNLIEHRKQQQALIEGDRLYEAENGHALIPLTIGATSERSAKPESWRTTNPANNLMFIPEDTIEIRGLMSVQEQKEAMSKAGPKEIVHANTRFPASGPRWEADDDDDTTSIHTSFIVRRNAGLDGASTNGGETPRVNGYAFVDEDEALPAQMSSTPSYRDLLAGQAGTGPPNPFKLKENRTREELHHKLVERDAEKKRAKQKDLVADSRAGNMTPAARNMMARLGGRTPVATTKSRRDDWTPSATPRRDRVDVGK